MTKKLIGLLVVVFLLNSSLNAQFEFIRNEFIPVSTNNFQMLQPWAGGINSAQVSTIDLNLDGAEDLFIFDRIGNRIMTFINQDPTPGAVDYKHDYSYVSEFPPLRDWVLMRDYNCDGKKDIFTSNGSAISVYKNVSDTELAFELVADKIYSSYNLSGTPFDAPVYTLSIDIPSIIDYDGDGDLDICSWSDLNTTVFYFENKSMETYGVCDSLTFVLGNRCYGQFSESPESFDLFTGDDFSCDFNVIDPLHSPHDTEVNRDGQHAGGVVFQIDLDQNGKLDLVVSDVVDDYMIALMMEEDTEGLDSAFMQIEYFPMNFGVGQVIDFATFPAAYYEDIDNDGIKDLFASPNNRNATRDQNSLWYYKNLGLNDLPEFNFIQEDFLQNQMIDLGRSAFPSLFDYNQDGLMDMVVTNQVAYTDSDNKPCRMALFVNTGTAENPAFTIVDDNFLDLESQGITRGHPAFGDLDNDGDWDMILGIADGTFKYYENQAFPGEEAILVLNTDLLLDFAGETIDIGQFPAPQLFDIDDDGILDLISGEKNGVVNLIKNIGTEENFSFELLYEEMGNAECSQFLGVEGYSVPFMFKDTDGLLQLILANEVGSLNHFNDIEGNLDGDFNLAAEYFEDIWEGTYSGAVLYDFTGDSKLDLIYGNIGGGLAFYQGGTEITYNVNEYNLEDLITIYPNPNNGVFQIYYKDNSLLNSPIYVYDSLGKLVLNSTLKSQNQGIDLSHLSNGIYSIVIQSEKGHSIEKMILRK